MRIVVDQRYVDDGRGRKILQSKFLDNTFMDASGSINVAQAKVSDWVTIPIYEDEWPDVDELNGVSDE